MEQLEEKGTWEFLGKSSSLVGEKITVNDIENYSSLVLQYTEDDGVIYYSDSISPEILKKNILRISVANTTDICSVKYISNTQVEL